MSQQTVPWISPGDGISTTLPSSSSSLLPWFSGRLANSRNSSAVIWPAVAMVISHPSLGSLRRRHHLLGGVGQVGRRLHRRQILLRRRQDLPRLFHLVAFQPHHHRHLEAHFL